jgi:hypothetical protein
MIQIIAQGIGFIAFLFVVLSFQKNKRYKILLFIGIAQILFTIHFGLLGAWTAAIINLIASTRTFIFNLKGQKKWADKKIFFYLFTLLFWVAGIMTWEGFYSLFPIVGVTLGTISLWMEHPRQIRFINLFPHPFWFTYNFIVGSYPGMITEVFVFTSVVIGILRFDRHRKPISMT